VFSVELFLALDGSTTWPPQLQFLEVWTYLFPNLLFPHTTVWSEVNWNPDGGIWEIFLAVCRRVLFLLNTLCTYFVRMFHALQLFLLSLVTKVPDLLPYFYVFWQAISLLDYFWARELRLCVSEVLFSFLVRFCLLLYHFRLREGSFLVS